MGKIMEQSLEEVMEEEELAHLRAQQRAFEELRHIELAELQRLQEQERRRSVEKVGCSFKTLFYITQIKSANVILRMRKHSLCLFMLSSGAQNCPAEGGVEERERGCGEDRCPGLHTAVPVWSLTSSLYITEKPRILL